jgi:hypothetical protein
MGAPEVNEEKRGRRSAAQALLPWTTLRALIWMQAAKKDRF